MISSQGAHHHAANAARRAGPAIQKRFRAAPVVVGERARGAFERCVAGPAIRNPRRPRRRQLRARDRYRAARGPPRARTTPAQRRSLFIASDTSNRPVVFRTPAQVPTADGAEVRASDDREL